jgi:hypothetical protein
MDNTARLARILELTSKIESQTAALKAAGGAVPRLDLDVLLRDTRILYDLLLGVQSQADAPARAPEIPEGPPPGESTGEAQDAAETLPPRPARHRVDTPATKPPATPGLFDEPVVSVHDKIARGREGTSLAEKLSALPAAELRKSIGINEKFKFVNELFEGNLQEYNACISRLDGAGSLAEAEAFIEEHVVRKYEADRESESFLSLLSLVQKKFRP